MSAKKINILLSIVVAIALNTSSLYAQNNASQASQEFDEKKIIEKMLTDAKNQIDSGWYEVGKQTTLDILRRTSDQETRKKAFILFDEAEQKLKVNYSEIRNWAGPKIGATAFLDKNTRQTLSERGIQIPVLSAFGWQFEWRFISGRPDEKIAGLVTFVPLLIGIEQGLGIISANLIIGLRFSSEFEIGVGPNITILPGLPQSAIVFVIGKNFKTAKLNFPLNLAVVAGKDVLRAAIVFGFNTANE
ncbi:MAG: hypothetical protein OEV66_09585 [Spirochaetia bacterium]|nr:hypothetical protein [Spirochaetia bacterium]